LILLGKICFIKFKLKLRDTRASAEVTFIQATKSHILAQRKVSNHLMILVVSLRVKDYP